MGNFLRLLIEQSLSSTILNLYSTPLSSSDDDDVKNFRFVEKFEGNLISVKI